jgi:hypothetical protein
MKGRKRRFYKGEIENAIIPPICRPVRVSLSLSLSLSLSIFGQNICMYR